MKLTAEAGVAHNLTESQFKKNMVNTFFIQSFTPNMTAQRQLENRLLSFK